MALTKLKKVMYINKNKKFADIDNTITITSSGILTDEMIKENKKNSDNYKKLLVILSAILVAEFVISVLFTADLVSVNFSIAKYFDSIRNNFEGLISVFDSGLSNAVSMKVFRTLIIIIVGASLALSGVLFQGVFRNPIASPGTVGAQSGALFASIAYVFLFMKNDDDVQIMSYSDYSDYLNNMSIWERYSRQMCSIIGAIITVAIVISIAKKIDHGKITVTTLLLLGTAITSFFQSLVSLVRFYMIRLDETDTRISLIQTTMMGSFNDSNSPERLAIIGISTLICTILIYIQRVKINVLIFGEDEAIAMGINTNSLRLQVIILAAILAAIPISFCGQIGFIGMIVPHISRKLCSADYKKLIPITTICGGIFMLAIYNIAVTFNASLYLNVVSSLICGTIFLVIMIQDRRRRNAEWG